MAHCWLVQHAALPGRADLQPVRTGHGCRRLVEWRQPISARCLSTSMRQHCSSSYPCLVRTGRGCFASAHTPPWRLGSLSACSCLFGDGQRHLAAPHGLINHRAGLGFDGSRAGWHVRPMLTRRWLRRGLALVGSALRCKSRAAVCCRKAVAAILDHLPRRLERLEDCRPRPQLSCAL